MSAEEAPKHEESAQLKFQKGGDKDLSHGPVATRRCTDIICVIIFLLHWVAYVAVTLAGYGSGNPEKLYRPRDYRGNFCGVKKQWNSNTSLVGFNSLIYMMNTSHMVDPIAKQLVCSSAAESALRNSGRLDASQLDEYMCACCKTPCATCSSTLNVADFGSGSDLAVGVASKMADLSDPNKAAAFLKNADLEQIFMNMENAFVKVCVTDCGIVNSTGNATRNFTYSPGPELPWRRAWETLATDVSNQSSSIRATMASQFTLQALPEAICPYGTRDCVPTPGITFTHGLANYCLLQLAQDAAAALGSTAEKLGLADLRNKATETFGTAVGDVIKSLDCLALVCVFAFVLGMVYMVMLRFFVGVAVWCALCLVFVLLLSGGSVALVRSSQCSGTSFTDTSRGYLYAAKDEGSAMWQTYLRVNGTLPNVTAEEMTGNGVDYRGMQTRSRSGRACQRWDSQSPQNHSTTPERYPKAGLVENYCRNPIGSSTIWCYTTDPKTRWEFCNPVGVASFGGTCPEGFAVPDSSARKALEVLAYVLFGMAGIWFVAGCCLYSRIRLAIQLNKVAAQFVFSTPTTLLVPILQSILAISWCLLWACSAAFLVSQVPDDYTPKTAFSSYAEAYGTSAVPGACTRKWPTGNVWRDSGDAFGPSEACAALATNSTGSAQACWRCSPPRYIFDARFAFSFFSYLWNNAVMIALGQCIIACACGVWFFSPSVSKYKPTVAIATFYMFRYHMGSVVFGAFLIAAVEFARAVIYYLQKQAEAQKNVVVVYLMRCLQCCMWCFEKCLKFLTKHAYVQVALMGTNFFTSAKSAFFLLVRNAARFGVLATLGSLIEVVSFMFLVSLTTLMGYGILSKLHPEVTPITPIILYIIVGTVVAKLFMSVFSMSVDSMLQCFIAAEEMGCDPDSLPLALRQMLPGGKPTTE